MSKVNSFTYELKTPVPYAAEGNPVEGAFIELSAPTSREMEHIASLKQMFYRALPKGDGDEAGDADEADESNEADTEAEIKKLSSKQIMALIYISEVNINKFLLTACELFKTVGLVDGEQKITKPILDKVTLEDREGMAGDYLLNFILASTSQNQKES